MNQLRVLHITPWFPLSEQKMEGIFIAEHIRALSVHCHNHVLHAGFADKERIETGDQYLGINVDRILLKPVIDKWRIKELLIERRIRKYIRQNKGNYDIINFYIAYPNAIKLNTYLKLFKGIRFIITEQWSAYHTEFGLPKGHKGRKRIENIFRNEVPLFVVSNSLGKDIRHFIGNNERKFEVVPNIIKRSEFPFKPKEKSKTFRFTSVNSWSTMKNPFVLIEATEILWKKYPEIRMTLAGNGHFVPEMEKMIASKGLEEVIELPGRILKKKVPPLLHQTNVYCQSSHYETFSVICIEALSTGTPVIAHKVGGMTDFINASNGILVDDLETKSWAEALEKAYLNFDRFDPEQISLSCQETYDQEKVGELFFKRLIKIPPAHVV